MKQNILTSGLERWPRQQSRQMKETPWEFRLPPLRGYWRDLIAAFILISIAIVAYIWLP